MKSVNFLFVRLISAVKNLQSFCKDSRKKTTRKLYEMSAKVILQTFCIPYEKVGKI